ncbi:MAG: hypothetical protein A4E48_02374 [Methanosaeta sp. PtaU1.Bin060]|nr:MAG: hypothetical protein A4E48_02374 [Methanosaeta sp. PtaU1.Bin060]
MKLMRCALALMLCLLMVVLPSTGMRERFSG